MSESKVFYYHFKPLNVWLIFNILVTLFLLCCVLKYKYCLYWGQFHVVMISIIISWGLWIFKHCFKQKLAVITDESIKIDHCRPLLWENITGAEEKIVRCCFKDLKIIILHTKPTMEYKYNFLQQHNGDFTPFSIPLYSVITSDEAKEIKTLISEKVSYKSLDGDEEETQDNEE